MVTTAATTYTATTDGERFYVQDGDGGFYRDFRDMIAVYETAEDAAEVASSLTERRPIRSRAQRPASAAPDAPVAYTANYEYWARVRYQGSLTELNGAVLSAEECGCRTLPGEFCDGYRLAGSFAGRFVVIEHSRRTSFEVLS